VKTHVTSSTGLVIDQQPDLLKSNYKGASEDTIECELNDDAPEDLQSYSDLLQKIITSS
jgi:hypothetical protein